MPARAGTCRRHAQRGLPSHGSSSQLHPVSLLLVGLVGSNAHAETLAPCIRAVDSGINMLVERGLAHSPTFRRLYEQLGQSDLIVHLERGPQPWLGAGFNQFVAEVGERRFVRITLNVAQLDADAVALLGHELQHAVELADAPDVDDIDGYERLYRRIGYRSCSRARRGASTPLLPSPRDAPFSENCASAPAQPRRSHEPAAGVTRRGSRRRSDATVPPVPPFAIRASDSRNENV